MFDIKKMLEKTIFRVSASEHHIHPFEEQHGQCGTCFISADCQRSCLRRSAPQVGGGAV
jgi:hypothetical protein